MSIALALISTGCVKLLEVCDLEHHMSDQFHIVGGTPEVCP